MALSQAIKQLIWIKRYINKIGLLGDFNDILLKEDNTSSIRLIKNPKFHLKTKHINIVHYYIRELIQ